MNERAREAKKQAVAAKVEAVNLANTEAIRLHPLLSEALAPFVGKKVIKIDGGLLEKVKAALPELPNGIGVRVHYDRASYSMRWAITASVSYAYSCCYHEASVTVGELDGCVLTKLTPVGEYRTDYSVAEVLALRAECDRAEQALRDANGALSPFGRYDR
jgi:hypothetical protein